jgi:hypothetical protein
MLPKVCCNQKSNWVKRTFCLICVNI